VRAFQVEKNTLIGPIKLFKNGGRLEDDIHIEFRDFDKSYSPKPTLHGLKYDSAHQTIRVPVLDELEGTPTPYTIYRWVGHHFSAK